MEKIGLLGPLGTYTEEAAVEYCSGASLGCEMVPYRTVSEVFCAVQDGDVSKGVVPVENLLNGHVMETLDNLYKGGLRIHTALVLPVRHCLAANSEGNIKVVKSHPQALAQCSDYLDANYAGADRVDAASTADAMKEISESGVEGVGVIGSEVAAKKYGLKVLAREIGNDKDNKTMFIVIGKGESLDCKRCRTSLVVVPSANKPGILSDILSEFAKENVDLKMIQSRPNGKGGYIFYIDIEGNVKDENVARVLEKLGDGSVIKVLGSYPYVSLSGV